MDVRTAFIAGISGVGLGYFLAVRRLKHVYAEMLNEEVQRTREFFDATRKANEPAFSKAVEAMAVYQGLLSSPRVISTNEYTHHGEGYSQRTLVYFSGDGVLTDDQYTPIENVEETVGKDNLNCFGEYSDDENVVFIRNENSKTDYEVFRETGSRSDQAHSTKQEVEVMPPRSGKSRVSTELDRPYIIGDEDFLNGDSGFEQVSLTWYAGDEVLLDQSDSVLENVDDAVGRGNLDRFGEKSGDPNIVYVRCPKLSLEFEVARSEGRYSVEVLGIDESSDDSP